MLPSQRALFDIPDDVCYLNAAGWSPLPRATQEAARDAVARKGQPWKLACRFRQRAARARPRRGGGADRRGAARCRARLVGRLRRRDRRESARRSRPDRACWCSRTTTPRRCSNGSRAPPRRTSWSIRSPAGGRRLDLGRAGSDRAAGRAASVACVDLVDPLVRRRASSTCTGSATRCGGTARRCWSTPRTVSAWSRPT